MAHARGDHPHWNSYRPDYDENSPRYSANEAAPRTPRTRNYSDYRRASPSGHRQRRPDDLAREPEVEGQGRYSSPNSRRHSLSTPADDLERNRKPLPTRSQILHDPQYRNPTAASNESPAPPTMPRMDQETLANITNEVAPKTTTKTPAPAEPVADPRKRLALASKNGPVVDRTSSPTLTPDNASPSKLSTDNSAAMSQARQNEPDGLSRETKAEVVVSVLMEFVDKSIETALLQQRRVELQEIADKARLADEKTRKNFKDHTALIEQSDETKRNAQKKASIATEKYDSSVRPRKEAAQHVANKILSLIEEPSNLNIRLTTVEQQLKQDQAKALQPSNQDTISLKLVKGLADSVEAILQDNKLLRGRIDQQGRDLQAVKKSSNVALSSKLMTETVRKVEDNLKTTKSEIAGFRNTVQQFSANLKATKSPLKAKEQDENVEEMQHSLATDFRSFVETQSKEVKDLRSLIEALDKARLKDFKEIATDSQKSQIAIAELTTKFTTSVEAGEARDEIVIENVETLSARMREMKTLTDDLASRLENHVFTSAKSFCELEDRNQREVKELAAKQADAFARKQSASLAAGSQTADELSNLKARLDDLESNLSALQAIGQGNDHSVKMLNNRFNNLTTENVTRAMAQQHAIMYPYAATAQAEFIKVREDRNTLELLRWQQDSMKLEIDKAFTSIKALENDSQQNEAKLNLMTDQFKEARDDLRSQCTNMEQKLADYKEEQVQSSSKIIDQIGAIQTSLSSQKAAVVGSEKRVAKEPADPMTTGVRSSNGNDTSADVLSRSNSADSDERTIAVVPRDGRFNDTRHANTKQAIITGSNRGTSDRREDNEAEYLEGWHAKQAHIGQTSIDLTSESSDSPLASLPGSGLETPHQARVQNGAPKKRKRSNWDPENNDRSDDETYTERKSSKIKSRTKKSARKT